VRAVSWAESLDPRPQWQRSLQKGAAGFRASR
jgi:hypothetical protein